VSETKELGRLGWLMARRLKKMAGLTRTKTSAGNRATGSEPERSSSAFAGEPLLRSLDRRFSAHDGRVFGDLVALMRKQEAAARRLNLESKVTRTGATRASANASEGAFKETSEPVESGRKASKMGKPSTRRRVSAISGVEPADESGGPSWGKRRRDAK
jgi:hypothetical protein